MGEYADDAIDRDFDSWVNERLLGRPTDICPICNRAGWCNCQEWE